jgi:crotonobetainyl-CoA:carnitine CoA-transferase CaiB-like acyl-CoA transferase
MPVALMDVLAAHHLKEAILLALYYREKTGKGQYIEASLFKAGVSSLANQATNWLVGEAIPERMGSDHPNIVPYGTIFKTADGKEIVMAAGTDKQYQQLITALGRPDLATDCKFEKNHGRVIHKAEINGIIQDLIIKYTRDEILEILQQKRIPAGGVFNMQEVFEVPEAEPMVLKGRYETGMEIKGVRSIAFTTTDKMSVEELSPPPHYGQHSREILSGILKYDEKAINELINKGVVYAKQ